MMPDHESLWIRAALTSGWPTLHVRVANEETLGTIRARVEAIVGPCPQADEISPWDPEDPHEPWEFRVALPHVSVAITAALMDRLNDVDAELVPGYPPGLRECLDTGSVVHKTEVMGVVSATQWIDPVDDRPLRPEVDIGRADEPIQALDAELVGHLRDVLPQLTVHSSRGEDTVEPIRHRSSGRLGVRWWTPTEDLLQLSEEPNVVNQTLLAALDTWVRQRATHPHIQIAPDLRWDARFGLEVIAWLIAPSIPVLPRECERTLPSVDPFASLASQARWLQVEVQVIPQTTPDRALAAARETSPPEQTVGSRPRWLWIGDAPHLALTWELPIQDAVAAREWANRMLANDDVAGVRIVPSHPPDWLGRWGEANPTWWWGEQRCLVRIHDERWDVDHLPSVNPRSPHHEQADILTSLTATTHSTWQPILDAIGSGWETRIHIDRDLESLLQGVGMATIPGTSPVATWAVRGTEAIIRLWQDR